MKHKTDNKSSPFKFNTVEQVSAGGAPFRVNDGKIEFAIVSVNPSRRWQLPKGLVDEDETAEHAALREVREEGGIECESREDRNDRILVFRKRKRRACPLSQIRAFLSDEIRFWRHARSRPRNIGSPMGFARRSHQNACF